MIKNVFYYINRTMNKTNNMLLISLIDVLTLIFSIVEITYKHYEQL